MWYRPERQQLRAVVEDDRIFIVGECLVLLHSDETDNGRWVCMANNSAGMERVDVSLQVTVPLSVAIHPAGKLMADIGSRAEFSCAVAGGDKVHLVWLKDGHVTSPTSLARVQFVIARVQREDAGMYQCLARGEADVAQASVQLLLGLAQPQLVYKFIQQTLQPGPPVSLKCIATGNPTPQISWQLDGQPLPSNTERLMIGQYVSFHGDVISHVNISHVQVEDGGIYKCTASNRIGDASHSSDMRVYGPPYVRPMVNISAVAGEPLYIPCPAAGYPLDSIIWEKESRKLPLNRRQRVFSNGTLLLENVQRDPDSGAYRCSAENKQGRASSQHLYLSVIVPPRIAPFAFLTDLHVSDRVGIQCFITKGDLPLDIKWRKDGGSLDSDVSVQHYGHYTSSLSIESLSPRHAGSYTCVASNPAATATHTSDLLVNVPPRWTLEPKDTNVSREGFAIFDCQAEGFPAPTLIWRKIIGRQPSDYQDLAGKSRGIQVFSNGTLIVRQALPEHQGQYLCEATNGIGTGLSATVSLVVLNPPEFEVKSAQTSVRKGSSQTLECEAWGDRPLTVTWLREGQPPIQYNPRYVIKETAAKRGVLSTLFIVSAIKSDSGIFMCIATNPFGRADRVVHLQVQDAPEQPQGLRVVDATSRTVSLSWTTPSDDRNPLLQYLVEFRQENGMNEDWEKISVNTEMSCVLRDLLPATKYVARVIAENELGAGEPSEPIVVVTEGEVPAGEPQNVAVTAIASHQLRVNWMAPLHHLWNGDILGYYVGYREHGLGRLTGFNFTTVTPRASGSGLAIIKGLNKYRKYGVVVQAFNEKGPGPMATEIVTQTLEDVPSAAPVEIKCEAQGSQSLLVSWQPPLLPYQNGLIQGYRLYYENMEEWPQGHIEAETRVTIEMNSELYGLQKYSNYSITVWAFTQVGDGVRSRPSYCMTDEDVPEAPGGIKVVVGSPSSLIVSWALPLRANGILTSFTLYSRVLEADRERGSTKKKLPPSQTHFQTSELRKGEAYEYWVTAFTRVGEGQSTQVVYATSTNRVPAAVVSFGKKVLARRRSRVVLECLAVGRPLPRHAWITPDGTPPHDHGFSISKEGSLVISDIQRQHQGNHTCLVSNANGSDHIVYDLLVLVSPSAPVVGISSAGTSWLHLQWSVMDTGGSAVRGFIINYRQQEPVEWEEHPVSRHFTSYRLTGLTCGTEYYLQVVAYNAVGSGAPSPTVVAKTDGNKPAQPSQAEFLTVNTTSVTLHMNAWQDNGCPITSFAVEYRDSSHYEWITVGSDVQARDMFAVVGLWPDMKYVVKVKATNSAGSTTAEYNFSTLTLSGVTLNPDSKKGYQEEAVPAYMDPGFLLPLSVSSLAAFSLLAAIFVCIKRKNERGVGIRNQTEAQSMAAMDNKHNIAQREQYYAAVHKDMATPTRDLRCMERIPDDISPYATFQLAGASPTNLQSFAYRDHRLATMETMRLNSECSTMGEGPSPAHHLKHRQSFTSEERRSGLCSCQDWNPQQGSPTLRNSAKQSATWSRYMDSAAIKCVSKRPSINRPIEIENKFT